MKTPTWAIIIGVLMILFGGCNIAKSLQATYLPEIMDKQHGIYGGATKTVSEEMESDSLAVDSLYSFRGFTRRLQDSIDYMFYLSDYSRTWIVRFGYIGIFVAIIYLLAGVLLLVKTKFSIMLVYLALGLSIVFNISQAAILMSDGSSGMVSKFMSFGTTFSMVIDIV